MPISNDQGQYSHIKALNMIAPGGSLEDVSVFPKVIDGDKQVKAIYVPNGNIVVEDLLGNTGTFTAYNGWLAVPIRRIVSSTVSVVILYLE